MIDPSLALQATVRARLVADLTTVPAGSIVSMAAKPELFPCVILRDGQTVYGDDFDSFSDRTFLDLHVWADSDETVKRIAGEVRAALRSRPWNVEDHVCHALTIASARYVTDPSGKGHGVLTVEAVLQARAAA
ncbi:DUF3168 domain-containing protein [Terrihabitans rhizophilus]|uniref:DUF3168 domain-containing protein n=1 Tax=Terrihabitans rhizophilus TaxID=3092662 RepID=A0ABU4RUA9_9HYPH|nr:DUF3168 domain-containing protein [Terrihabitans sp. PJ23]MDX6806431.1 DUF3168 domain-containing protein [Terrihabitans sp. PJ23]